MTNSTLGWAAAAALAGARVAHAQCVAPIHSNEAKLIAFYEAPIVFAPAGAPGALAPGGLSLTGDVTYVPPAPRSIQTTTLCYASRPQSTKLAPVAPRLRLALGLPFGFAIEGSYLPPVTVRDATPNFGSLAVSYTRAVTPFVTLEGRAHGTVGTIRGPITCPSSGLQQSNPAAPCFGSRQSNDTFYPRSAGADLSAGVTPARGRMTVYGGVGYAYYPGRFQVGFTDLSGTTDNTVVVTGLSRESVFGGVEFRIIDALSAGAQVYSVPADVTTFRVSARYHL
jgi:hypothetical protein